MHKKLLLGWVVSAVAFAACTNDYDTFENKPGTGGTVGDASPDVAKGGTAGASGKGGTGGIAGAAGASKGGSAGQAGTNQGGTSGQGGANQGGTSGQGGINQGGASGDGGLAGSAGDAATEETGGCTSTEKLCNTTCVQKTDPAFGCVDSTCDPCALANATPQCTAGACDVQSCDSGFGDCDGDATNGCEADTATDVNACGGCNRKCLSTHVATGGLACAAELCTSTCETGYANCAQPAAPSPDDGCETDLQASATDCGACGHDCTLLGPSGSKMGCVAGACGCGANADCGGNGVCNTTTGICTCGSTQCDPGEWCRKTGPNWVCTCFANADCPAGQVCCPTTNSCTATCPL